MRSLQLSDYKSYRKVRLLKRQKGTCTWILENETFLQWKEYNQTSPVLWISGGPGFGKSVLSAFLTENIPERDFTTIYFLCDNKDSRLNFGTAIVSHWLGQLLERLPGAYIHFTSIASFQCAESRESYRWALGELFRVLKNILTDPYLPKICLLVDALGEDFRDVMCCTMLT